MAKLNARNQIWKVRVKEPASQWSKTLVTNEYTYTRRRDAENRASSALAGGGTVLDFAKGEITWSVDREWMDEHGTQLLINNLAEEKEI